MTNGQKEGVKSQEQLVSVVLTIYQGDNEEYIRLAFSSLLAQTYIPIEILMVIDGCIDNAKTSLINEFNQCKAVRLIFISSNAGPAAARNAGIMESRGDYIAIMDSDDISHSERIAIQKSYLEKEDLDIISSPMCLIDDQGNIIGNRIVPTAQMDVLKLAPYGCPMNNPAVFARADVLKNNLYNESYRLSEDYDLWVRLLIKGYRLGNTCEMTVFYRQPSGSIAKRVGVRYAWSDLLVKTKASQLVLWYRKPLVYIVALLTFLIRLLPVKLFSIFYRVKAIFYRALFKDDSQKEANHE